MPGVIARRSVTLAVVVAGTGLATAPASFGAVTVGSDLTSAPTGPMVTCGVPCTLSQGALPPDHTAAGGLTSPLDGIVVRWRVRVGGSTAAMALRVTRPGDSPTRTGAGTGPTVTPPVNNRSTFENVRIPIRAGDAIGLNCCTPNAAILVDTSGANALAWQPPLVDGDPARSPTSTIPYELTFNADIERDGDGDAHGDETQDVCFTDSSTQGACPAPTVSGAPQHGQTLTADPGGSPTNPSFQWLRCEAAGCGAIPGATGASYTITREDVGRTLRVRKTAENASGTQSTDSAPTGVAEFAPGPCANLSAGTEGPDALNGTSAGDGLSALGGDDSINGVQGDDCLDGGAGNDVGSGGEGSDRLGGGDGRDRLSGDFGADVLRGDSGNDSLDGGPDGDRLSGGAGRDKLTGGAGANRYSGGGGNDTVDAANGRRDRVNCGAGRRDSARVDSSDRVRKCERVTRVSSRRAR